MKIINHILVVSVLGLAGCSLDNTVAATPTIKGLELGMDIDQAASIINKDLPDKQGHVFSVVPSNDPFTGEPGFRIDTKYVYQMTVEAGTDKKVNKIIFGTQVMSTHFKTDDMTPEEVGQSVIDNYGIPSLTPTEQGWEFRNADEGFILTVNNNKSIKLESITKKTEQSFN